MQELLRERPEASLVVHAVWFEALPVVDKRESWPADLLTDPRVVHHWDAGGLVPRFFGADPAFRGKGLIGWSGVMWDTYLLFGRDAHWTDRPAPLVGAGFTILAASRQLAQDLETALCEERVWPAEERPREARLRPAQSRGLVHPTTERTERPAGAGSSGFSRLWEREDA